jgi:alkaline phosphatase
MQMLNPRFGNGPEVVIGTGRKWITEATAKMGRNLANDIAAKSYTYLDSFAAISQLNLSNDRVIALFDDTEFDINQAVEQAVTRLSRNPKGYLLVVFSDCHLGKTAKSLQRIVDLDKAVRDATEKHKSDTLILMTADHEYDLRIKGEALVDTAITATRQQIAAITSLEDQHTA